ncbi:unnamed protein product [Oikopleura dioica]|uniref:Sushi domain-containing protein n=2 Tax=Oikopleura dioica TaxID=34765 RepID=E4WZ08_OIKDI|nr:unnamed protein product [Oikopleura dioica]
MAARKTSKMETIYGGFRKISSHSEMAQPNEDPKKEQPKQNKREIQCFTCVNAKTNDECNAAGQTTCQLADAACMTEVRNFGYGEKLISKKCKDKNACHVQQKTNSNSGRWGKQCQPDWFESVCRCCCMNDLCNAAELPCLGMVEEKDCDLAPTLKPLNGTVACSNGKKTNSKCTITCDEGFTISGENSDRAVINCGGSGKWSGLIKNTYPKCEIKKCPFILDNPIEGVTSCSLGEEYGSSCSIFCNQGYSLNFKERITPVSCTLVNGKLMWQYNESPELVEEDERILMDSTNMPTCEYSKCIELNINGADMSCTDDNRYKSVCTIQCVAGRRRTGPAKQICRGLQVPSWQGVDEIGDTKCVQDIDG